MALSIGPAMRKSRRTQYDVRIFDETIITTVTANPPIVVEWLQEAPKYRNLNFPRTIVGLDALFMPSSTRGDRGPLETLQLCVGHRCLIYQLGIESPKEVPGALSAFLGSDLNVFVGVGKRSKLAGVVNDSRINCGTVFYSELGRVAAARCSKPELQDASLRLLSRLVLGRDFVKPPLTPLPPVTMTPVLETLPSVMSSPPLQVHLEPDQVLHASIEPFVASEIAQRLAADEFSGWP